MTDIVRIALNQIWGEGLFCFSGVAGNTLHSSYDIFHSFTFLYFSSLIPLDFDLISESFQLFRVEKESEFIYSLTFFMDFFLYYLIFS